VALAMNTGTRYCIITPVRDEETYIAQTVASVLAQTIRPQEWLIVDDGSRDGTGRIIDEYAREHDWIRALHLPSTNVRSTGGGIKGFLSGYSCLQTKDWDFLVNLDGDLSFAPDYFERCFQHFASEPKLGIAGGTIFNKVGDELRRETVAEFHVRGATKIYRRACWDVIGGMLPGLGWDTFDEVKANMKGWTTRSFPELEVVHYRYTGTAGGLWWGLVKDGQADYIIGYHPLFFLAKCARRILKPPYLVGSFGLFYGWLKAHFGRVARVPDPEFIEYVRRQQWNRLIGKETIWR
jgi:biofilm PGA synthesis N-glycosyltransferase PgaC